MVDSVPASPLPRSRADRAGPPRRGAAGLVFLLCVLLLPPLAAARADPPRVVVSIKPIASLVAAIMAGVATPDLIVRGAASEHGYVLRPSDARRLARAQLVFWIGPILENYLEQPLAALAGGAKIVELAGASGVRLLPARGGGSWERDSDAPPRTAAVAAGTPEAWDPHLWLDPMNAIAIIHVVVPVLAGLDPPDAGRYAENAAALERRLVALDARLQQQLAPLHGRPFIVFHDAYQYFERRYGLMAVGSITIDPEHQPGARRLAAIHDRILRLGVPCVFREPQFEPALVRSVIAGTPARSGVLDPLGATIAEGPDLYPRLIERLADGLTACLGRPG